MKIRKYEVRFPAGLSSLSGSIEVGNGVLISGCVTAQRKIRVTRDGLVRCRVCGCTEIAPCEPPCSWVEVDLCSGCVEAIDAMYTWFHGGHRPSLAALLREYKYQVYDTPVPYVLTKKAAQS